MTATQGPNPQTRTMAIVHVSIHDAVNSITGEQNLSVARAKPGRRVAGSRGDCCRSSRPGRPLSLAGRGGDRTGRGVHVVTRRERFVDH